MEISEIQSSELAGKENSKYWNQSIKKRNLRSRWGSTNRERCTCTWGNNVTAENYKSTGEKGEYTERGTAATRFSFSITFLSLCYSFLCPFLFFFIFSFVSGESLKSGSFDVTLRPALCVPPDSLVFCAKQHEKNPPNTWAHCILLGFFIYRIVLDLKGNFGAHKVSLHRSIFTFTFRVILYTTRY